MWQYGSLTEMFFDTLTGHSAICLHAIKSTTWRGTYKGEFNIEKEDTVRATANMFSPTTLQIQLLGQLP